MAKKPEPVVTVFVAQHREAEEASIAFLDETECRAYCYEQAGTYFDYELPIYATADDAIKAEG